MNHAIGCGDWVDLLLNRDSQSPLLQQLLQQLLKQSLKQLFGPLFITECQRCSLLVNDLAASDPVVHDPHEIPPSSNLSIPPRASNPLTVPIRLQRSQRLTQAGKP
jgi:hypothetical protein